MGNREWKDSAAATRWPARAQDDTPDPLPSGVEGDDDGEGDLPPAAPPVPDGSVGEQADFRERFDEDLYNDREDRPAQGNTADVAMGDHRFGSDADAYAEYAWRRPGDHHRGDESAVGQSRDPADSRDDGTKR